MVNTIDLARDYRFRFLQRWIFGSIPFFTERVDLGSYCSLSGRFNSRWLETEERS